MAYWWGANLVPKPQESQCFLRIICGNLRAENYWDTHIFYKIEMVL